MDARDRNLESGKQQAGETFLMPRFHLAQYCRGPEYGWYVQSSSLSRANTNRVQRCDVFATIARKCTRRL
jgi:hypothetical protein